MAGAVTSLAANPRRRRRHTYRMLTNRRNPRRRYRHNPNGLRSIYSTGYFGLPSIQSVLWSVVGFSATAAIQTFLWGSNGGTGILPAQLATNADGTPSMIAKYGVLLASVAATHMLVRWFRPAWAATSTIGAGLFAASQIVHDVLPGVIPGMRAYTPIYGGSMRAYTPIHHGGRPGMAAYHQWSMPQLASQNIGASNLPVGWAKDGAMDILSQRFRRFN
jgi:hypothetical protein